VVKKKKRQRSQRAVEGVKIKQEPTLVGVDGRRETEKGSINRVNSVASLFAAITRQGSPKG